jgi:glucose dehydrogenase
MTQRIWLLGLMAVAMLAATRAQPAQQVEWAHYAFETKTGKEAWRAAIPYTSTANPMTYRTNSGKQFIVMATGTSDQNALLAFAVEGK